MTKKVNNIQEFSEGGKVFKKIKYTSNLFYWSFNPWIQLYVRHSIL